MRGGWPAAAAFGSGIAAGSPVAVHGSGGTVPISMVAGDRDPQDGRIALVAGISLWAGARGRRYAIPLAVKPAAVQRESVPVRRDPARRALLHRRRFSRQLGRHSKTNPAAPLPREAPARPARRELL